MNHKSLILIDARLYGPSHTGIGRYVQNLLIHLVSSPNFHHYRWSLLVYPELLDQIQKDLGSNFDYYPTRIRHYTLSEQIFLPLVIYRLHPQLFHVPHFNKPILYFGKTVVTIHDLIKHFSKGKGTTTKNQLLYWPKYFAYLLLSRLVINHNHLIVPTDYWRDFIIKNYCLNPKNIITTHEAVDPTFFQLPPKSNSLKPQNYLLYSGNLYPHKNITIVLEALQKLPKIRLKIISKPNVFLDRTRQLVKQKKLDQQVEFLGFVDDSRFSQLYHQAMAYVFPSLMEGFGLPGLEAQALGCPVISSDSSCLPEVYGDSVLYFHPQQPQDLIDKIIKLQTHPKLRRQLINRGLVQAKKYDWNDTAQKTINYYESILS